MTLPGIMHLTQLYIVHMDARKNEQYFQENDAQRNDV